jgi:hypothetical protein
MGKTTPTTAVLMQQEKAALSRYRRALRKEDQQAFDALWVHVTKHMMACTQANHLLPLETFLLTMLLEEHKEIQRLQRMVAEIQEAS